ncbi:MAG: class I SAM-dependent methyltransferase [Candidatus Doudnabacteria bacterium]
MPIPTEKKIKKQPADYYYQGYYHSWSLRSLFYRKKFKYILKKLKENRVQNLLDLGCGNGILLKLAQEEGIHTLGVDNDINFLKIAEKILGKGEVVYGDILKLTLKKKFNAITCLDVLEHFQNQDLPAVFSNISAHLKNQGILIITFPSKFYIKIIEPVWKIIRFLIYGRRNFIDEDIHNLIKLQNIKKIAQNNNLQLKDQRLITGGLLNYLIFQNRRTFAFGNKIRISLQKKF